MNTKGKYYLESKEIRIYKKEDSCIFKKNKDEFGGLSNMATGFPLMVNNIRVKTTEALYQACRFPHISSLQREIIEQKSPMNVKMISNKNKKHSRTDWDSIRLKVMKWCLNVKLAQNFITFGMVLHETGLKNIVENSSKDNFWGAIPDEDATIFTGKNALGRLLMDLRQIFFGKDCYSLLYIAPPGIENFLIYNEAITIIDERQNFVDSLLKYWNNINSIGEKISQTIEGSPNKIDSYSKLEGQTLNEDANNYISSNSKEKKKRVTRKKDSTSGMGKLFDD